MRFDLYFVLSLLWGITSCKTDQNATSQSYNIEGYNDIALAECVSPGSLSDVMPYEALFDAFDLNVSDIRLRDNSRDAYRTRGYAKWDIPNDYGSRGMYISLSRNKYEEHGSDYVEKIVVSLKTLGEKDANGKVDVYKEWIEIGDDSAYSPQERTYVWQIKNCLLCKIVFNLPYDDKKIEDAARQIAQQITEEYLEKAR